MGNEGEFVMIVQLTSLWLPILLSAVAVFVASSLIWTVVQYHHKDWHPLPNEEAARQALKGTPPGQYSVPYAADGKARQDPEWQRKFTEGPAAMMVVFPGSMAMGRQLIQWFIYCLVLSLLIGYVAAATLPAGTEYAKVFQITGTTGWLAYAGSAAAGSIWFGHSWGRTAKDLLDGLIYGLLTAGTFGWLWP
jgi:hypothetical protein